MLNFDNCILFLHKMSVIIAVWHLGEKPFQISNNIDSLNYLKFTQYRQIHL